MPYGVFHIICFIPKYKRGFDKNFTVFLDFIMNGGSIRGNTAAGRGGGICVESYGEITLNDGVIENNVAHGNGGGISACWGAEFMMNGGVVKNNESDINGGGIFLFGNGGWKDANSTFTITGGTVTNNKAGGVGGGIYFYEYTTFTMNATTADIIITDNEGSNLYLTDNKSFVITLTALTEGSRIGVTAMRNPWTISTANEADHSHKFSSDSDYYHVEYNSADKKLALTSHVLTEVDRIEPDCTHDGKEAYWSCECGKYFEDAGATVVIKDISTWGILPAYHTTLTKVDKIAPDCTHDGKDAYWSCSVCGKYYADEAANVEIENIDSWGILPSRHTVTKVNKVEPGCTHDGKEAYWSCECGKHFEDPEATVEIADIDAWSILPEQHKFTNLIAEVSATCEKEGVKAHKDCKICHKHFDADGNEITDLTIAKLTIGEGEPGEESANNGLSDGAIAGITLSSVAVAEIGGFPIFWFAIRKKSLSDLISAIKGIFKK